MPDNDKIVIEKGGKKFLIPNRKDRIEHYLKQQFEVSRDQSLAIPKPPPQEEEGGATKLGRGAALGAFSGLGVAETQTPVQDTLKGLKETLMMEFVRPYTHPSLKTWKESLLANPAITIPESLFKSGAEVAEAAGANPQKPSQFGPVDMEKLGHGLGSLLTQVLSLRGGKEAAETPLAESQVVRGAKALPEVPKTASRELLGIGEKSVEREKAAAEKTAQAEKETSRKKYAEDFAAKEKEKVEQSRTEGKRKSLEVLRDKRAKEVVENLDATDEKIKTAFDAEYQDAKTKLFGVDKRFSPKGTLEIPLQNLADSVTYAERNVIKGSPESIKQFREIMSQVGDIKSYEAGQGGELRPVTKKPILADDALGLKTELNKRIYDADLLPDVRDAMKHVVKTIDGSVESAIGKRFGAGAVRAFKDLNTRYSQYLTDWKDSSSASPIPKIRQLLREPIRKNAPDVPIEEKIAPMLEGTAGNIALPILAKYRKYGLDPAVINSYRKAAQGASEAAKPKAVEPLERPKTPETKPFNAEEFRKEKIGKKAENLSNLSMWDIAAISAGVERLLTGHPLQGASALSIPAIKRLLARGLSKEGVIDWLSKEGPTP